MFKPTKLAAAFACTAALAACDDARPPAISGTVEAANGTNQIHAVTRLHAMGDFIEFSSPNAPNVTCFLLLPHYPDEMPAGEIACMEGSATAVSTRAAQVQALSPIGTASILNITPASRPDVSCYATVTHMIVGGMDCKLKP